MPALDPAVAATRGAVRAALADLTAGDLVLAAVSGGPDSTALAAALAFVAPRRRLRAGAVVVDHGLRPDSGERAAEAAARCTAAGLDPVELRRVTVGASGGPEAAARAARYAALDAAADASGAAVVLLGHTRDDQAETVLLGLGRGSGARSLAGMAPVAGRYRRPFLGVDRSQTHAACAALGLLVHDDPHNGDRAFARVRVRLDALPALQGALGPGVGRALARTARLLRDDADALDAVAAAEYLRVVGPDGADVAELAALPRGVRTRVLRRLALLAGVPPGALGSGHVDALDALVTDWHGQGPVALPRGWAGARHCGRLRVDEHVR